MFHSIRINYNFIDIVTSIIEILTNIQTLDYGLKRYKVNGSQQIIYTIVSMIFGYLGNED